MELPTGPDDQFFGEPAEVHAADGNGGEEFQREIPVRDRVQRIGHGLVEAQGFGGHVTVDRKGGAGQGRGAERRFIQPLPRIGETAAVASQHFDIGEQVMAEGDRLCRLQMGESGHDRIGMPFRLVKQHQLQPQQSLVEPVDGIADPQAQIGRYLIVARACRVQPSGGRADQEEERDDGQVGERRHDLQGVEHRHDDAVDPVRHTRPDS